MNISLLSGYVPWPAHLENWKLVLPHETGSAPEASRPPASDHRYWASGINSAEEYQSIVRSRKAGR